MTTPPLIVTNTLITNNLSTNQKLRLTINNHSKDDFFYKFLVEKKYNKLCFISPPNGIIKRNNTKEIKINISSNAINNLDKILIYTLNTKYINEDNVSNIWTKYNYLIEKYTINVKYIEHKIKETTNSCIYLYIIIFMLFILGLVYFLF